MAKINNKAFTLVELLAVIVILAVVLVIAVPQIISTITEARKGALASSAKLIASSAESMKISNDTLGVNEEIECTDVAQLTSEDYDTCKIDFVDGDAYVSIIGKGKFEGMAVLSGTVEKAEAIRTTGLELTDDGNIRYTGSNPSNYIEFGNDNELWRIIGTFEVTTASGKTEKLMKIVRNDSIGRYSWDSSVGNNNGAHGDVDNEVNDGYGVNQWGASTYTNGSAYEGADLMRELNTLYLNQGSGTCYNGSNNASTTCNFSTTGLKDTYRGMIESVVWNTGAFSLEQSAKTVYQAERGTTTGQICKGTTYQNGVYCTDTVTRTTTWTGKIGLIYPSDYGYASTYVNSETGKGCRDNINDNTNYSCKNENWLHNNTTYWTLSPTAHYGTSRGACYVYSSGYVTSDTASFGVGVRPSVYLRSNVSITSGDGSSSSPYQVSM